MATPDLIKAVAVTAELCGRVFSPEAAAVFVSDIETYPEKALIRALARCRREVKGVLTVHDVVTRLEDGRPGPEEAWSMLPHDEATSTVWTDEMSASFGVCARLLDAGDKIAARMAFKEAYQHRVMEAREQGRAVNWTVSLGHDPRGREHVVMAAVAAGRISAAQAMQCIPHEVAANVLARVGYENR